MLRYLGKSKFAGESQDMNKHIAASLKGLDKGLLVLLVLPWLLLINNEIWLFDFHILIDPWIYLGLFLRFQQLSQVYGDTYYVGRLAWILPGHFAFEVFPPLVAQYILHIGFYYLAVLSIYFLLRRTVGYRSALLASVMMGCHAWFLIAIGSNYVNGAGIAYCSITLLMLTLAAQRNSWKILLLISGIFYGLAIYSQFAWILLAPALVFYYIFINHGHQKHPLIRSGISFFAGLVAITLILSMVNFFATGRFFFFLPSLGMVSHVTSHQQNPWKLSWNIWLPSAFWLTLLATTFFSGIALNLISHIKKLSSTRSLPIGFHSCLLLASLPFVILEARNQPVLQVYFYAGYLIPLTFIAIGAQFSQLELVLDHLKEYQFVCIIAGTILLTLLAYRVPIDLLIFQNSAILLTLFFCVLWLVWAGAALFVRQQAGRLLSSALLIILLTFNVVNVASIAFSMGSLKTLAIALGYTASNPEIPSNILSKVNYSQRRDAFLLVVQAQRYLQVVDPSLQSMFWYDLEELLIYRSIASASLWNHLSESFPLTGVKKNSTQKKMIEIKKTLERNSKLVILSQKPAALEQAKRSLNELGFDADLVSTHDVKQGELAFKMTFIKVYKHST